jgi:N-acetylglucosamine-6-phosphate deacetylase
MAAGMPNGEYRIGPSKIEVIDGYSQSKDGTLAGTTTMLESGWHSLMSCGHLSDIQAAPAVTVNPAKAYGISKRGVLLPNRLADLAVFEQNTNRPLLTVCKGQIVYKSEEI